MWEDRLKRRLQRWSQWQTRLASAAGPGDARADHSAVRHWSRSMPGPAERARLLAEQNPVNFDPVQAMELSHGIEAANSLGRYWHISRPLMDVWPASRDLLAKMPRPLANAGVASDELSQFIQAFPGRTLFLDLETCGLAGSAIFLVGLIRASAGPELILEQLWARNHAEEAGVMGALREIADGCDVLITFNGKSFDWPQVRDRTTLHTRMVGAIKQLAHLDLLHLARRRFKKRFGDCRLQTLERHVCGRFRVADLGSERIPAAYAEYVRTGDARLVRSILHHNTLDLVTLLQLAVTLAGGDTECGTAGVSG